MGDGKELEQLGQHDPDPRVPADWGLPGWSPERFKAFNNARRKVHKLMQRWEQILPGQSAVIGKSDLD